MASMDCSDRMLWTFPSSCGLSGDGRALDCSVQCSGTFLVFFFALCQFHLKLLYSSILISIIEQKLIGFMRSTSHYITGNYNPEPAVVNINKCTSTFVFNHHDIL